MQLICYYDTSVIKPNKKPLTIYWHICLATVTSSTIIVSFWNSYFSYFSLKGTIVFPFFF